MLYFEEEDDCSRSNVLPELPKSYDIIDEHTHTRWSSPTRLGGRGGVRRAAGAIGATAAGAVLLDHRAVQLATVRGGDDDVRRPPRCKRCTAGRLAKSHTVPITQVEPAFIRTLG